MRNSIALLVYRLIIFVSLFCIFLLAFWGLQVYFKDNGTVKVTATNVENIDNISASGIVAYLFDHYYFPANEITFSDDIALGYCSDYGGIQYQDGDGNWVNVQSLQVQPLQNDGRLVLASLPGRVDYTIGTACFNAPEDPLSFPCSMKYHFVSESKFKYILNAPYMEIYLHFQDEEHTHEYDEFFIEFSIENCIVSCLGEEITGPFRLLVWNNADAGFEGEIWSHTGLILSSLSGSPCITDTFSGSATIEDVAYPDQIFFTYANGINARIDGNLLFRYGSNSTDYELFSEHVCFHLDESALEEDKNAQIDYFRTTLNWNEDYAWFSFDVFEPNLMIESLNLDNTRTTTFEINGTVDKVEINGISLFPNIKTLFIDNSMNIEIVGSIIIAAITYVLPAPEKIASTKFSSKKKTGKFLKE